MGAVWCAPGKQFQPLEAAPAAVAHASGGASTLQLQTRGSKFVRFQEVKLQERAIEVCPLCFAFDSPNVCP